MRAKALMLAGLTLLPACLTIEERHLFLDPIVGPDDPVIDAREEEPTETTYAALTEETGGEAGVFGGTVIAFGGAVSSTGWRGGSRLEGYDPAEGTAQLRDLRRLRFETPVGAVSAVRADGTDDGPDSPLIVHCSGTASTIDTTALFTAFKIDRYAGDMLLFDYPGYGRSEGERSVAGVEAAVEAVAAYLERPDSRPLVLWGYSLGGFACAELAARTEPDALVLDSPVRNAREGARFFVPGWLYPVVRPLIRFDPALKRFDVVDSLAGVEVPILVIGAEHDGVLPEAGARRLHEALRAAGHRAAYVQAKGEGHLGLRDGSEVVEAVNALLDVPKGARPIAPPEEF